MNELRIACAARDWYIVSQLMTLPLTSPLKSVSVRHHSVKAHADAFKLSLEIFSRHSLNGQDCSGDGVLGRVIDGSNKGQSLGN